jgi:hypothetical protein
VVKLPPAMADRFTKDTIQEHTLLNNREATISQNKSLATPQREKGAKKQNPIVKIFIRKTSLFNPPLEGYRGIFCSLSNPSNPLLKGKFFRPLFSGNAYLVSY